MLKVSVVIPVYRSEQSIGEVMDRVRLAMAGEFVVEFVIVDDDSPDGSWKVICDQAEAHGDVRAIRHLRNRGHNIAAQSGLEIAKGDWVVTMDDDLQHAPEDVPKLLKHAIANDYDVVFGTFSRRNQAFYRNLGSRIYLWFLCKITGAPAHLQATSFRAMRRPLVDQLSRWQIGQPQASYMIFKSTTKIGNLEVPHHERRHGTSSITVTRAVRLVLDSLIYFSSVPLKLATLLAMLTFCIGTVLASGYVYKYYTSETSVAGFTTIVVLIISFGASNLLLTGIVGLYVCRLMEEIAGRVTPVVRDFITPEDVGVKR